MDVSELFRHKLENAEVTPGASFNAELMKRLARREFVRFNPARFNIYYAAFIVAATITAGILLFSEPAERKDKKESTSDPETSMMAIPEPEAIVSRERKTSTNSVNRNRRENEISLPSSQVKESGPATREQDIIKPASSGSISKDAWFKGAQGRNTLQAPAREKVLFAPSATHGCSPLKVHFTNMAGDFDNYSWSFGDGGYSDLKDPDWIFDVEGEYRVVMTASSGNGAKASCAALIIVYPKPQALFEMSPEKAVIPDDEIRFINYSANAVSYKWEFGDGNSSTAFEPKHRYEKFGKYDVSLILTSEHGCTDTMVVDNAFSGTEYFIKMPNAFIPNPHGPSGGLYSTKSDELAEIFHPTFSGVDEYQLRIFSKMGILIFESNDINIGWDGYFKGQPGNPGVYVWKIRGTFLNGEPFTRMGDVTLLKN